MAKNALRPGEERSHPGLEDLFLTVTDDVSWFHCFYVYCFTPPDFVNAPPKSFHLLFLVE